MRVAPPVQASSCSAGPWLKIQLALYALSAAVAVWWAASTLWEPGAAPALASLLAAAIAAIFARRELSVSELQLVWDGSAWRLQSPGGEARSGRVMLMLDLGHWMLVRFSPADAGRLAWRSATWLPLSRRDVAASWPALRVALHAPQPALPAA